MECCYSYFVSWWGINRSRVMNFAWRCLCNNLFKCWPLKVCLYLIFQFSTRSCNLYISYWVFLQGPLHMKTLCEWLKVSMPTWSFSLRFISFLLVNTKIIQICLWTVGTSKTGIVMILHNYYANFVFIVQKGLEMNTII